jgi:hypothetical protein
MLSLASTQSPWVHVRIHERHGRWPKTFGISLPIPARPAAWILRRLGSRIPQLRDTAVDELLLALDRGRYEGTPLHVEVDEGPNGERIEVYIG